MKHLLLTTLLLTNACAAVPVAVGSVAFYKTDQAANHIAGGTDGNTITEDDYQACKAGDKAACTRCDLYSIGLLPADIVAGAATGELGSGHCKTWHEADKMIPTISTIRKDYGGAKYWAMQENE